MALKRNAIQHNFGEETNPKRKRVEESPTLGTKKLKVFRPMLETNPVALPGGTPKQTCGIPRVDLPHDPEVDLIKP